MTFTFVRRIGLGGYGDVWLVTDETGKKYALKKLREHTVDAVRFLKQEAQKLLTLRGVSGIIGLVTWNMEGAEPFIVMDLAEDSLDKVTKKGPTNSFVAAAIIREVARAVAETHARGVVHLDIKPANILIKDGRHMLADFGLGKGTDSICMTMGGRGTPGYMAPEQYAGALSPECDIYGLGATFYHLITGQFPPQHAVLDPRLAKPQCPVKIATLVQQMTAAAPEDRPSLAQIQQRLDSMLAEHLADEKAAAEFQRGLFKVALGIAGGAALIAIIVALLRAK